MKRALFLLLLVFTTQAQAQQSSLASGQLLYGQFTETRHMHGFKGDMISQGHFVLTPDQGLTWTTEKPFLIETTITADHLKQTTTEGEVTNLDATRVPFLRNLYETFNGALLGDMKALDKDFIVTRSQKANAWTIDLQPRQSDMITVPFSSIHLVGHHFIDTVHMVRNDGDSVDLSFHDQYVSSQVSDRTK